MKYTLITIVTAGAAALMLSGGAAVAAEPADMQDRPAVSEEVGLGVHFDLSQGADHVEAVVVDEATGRTVADVSDQLAESDVTVNSDGTVTAEPATDADD